MAPDLVMQVTGDIPRARAKDIAAQSKHRDDVFTVYAESTGSWSRRAPWRLDMPEGHDLLTDQADFHAATWAMDSIGLYDARWG
jgi:hypothetical protein